MTDSENIHQHESARKPECSDCGAPITDSRHRYWVDVLDGVSGENVLGRVCEACFLSSQPRDPKAAPTAHTDSGKGQLAEDMLRGADAIADYMGTTTRRIYYLVEKGGFPSFREGTTLCARKSTLMRWIEDLEARAIAKDGAP